MGISHISRSGKPYYLHVKPTKTGKLNYFFAQDSEGPIVEAIPAGFEIYESVGGQVFLRRKRAQVITAVELSLVQEALKSHAEEWRYKVEIKKNMIIVHEACQDLEGFKSMLPWVSAQSIKQQVIKSSNYQAVLRFLLVEPKKRVFVVERYCFRGSVDDWISVGEGPKSLPLLVKKYVRHLGQESMYDLY